MRSGMKKIALALFFMVSFMPNKALGTDWEDEEKLRQRLEQALKEGATIDRRGPGLVVTVKKDLVPDPRKDTPVPVWRKTTTRWIVDRKVYVQSKGTAIAAVGGAGTFSGMIFGPALASIFNPLFLLLIPAGWFLGFGLMKRYYKKEPAIQTQTSYVKNEIFN